MQSLDEFQLHAVLASRPGVSLVLFTSPTCSTCRRVEALLPAAAPAMAHLFKVDVQRATGLARAYEVFHLPALFLFRDGRYHARLDCEITPAALEEAIRAALAAPPEEEP